ncbi:GNAT family N-acetyltransferase [Alkalicoccobacillus plakortidis]|uniref:GNAT family N-acetyltransferase n=1 Tax=Shouchella oshimensis TaxID=290588 RepID=UPI0022A8EFE0|nr:MULTISPECIES: GNAT family N-acetyltransferase [Bacillaceae]
MSFFLGTEDQRVVGFITVVSDGVLAAYIPFLEVLPEYKHQGIGKTLVTRMLEGLRDYYVVDLCCEDDLVGFYQSFQMAKGNGMMIRHYRNQAGK